MRLAPLEAELNVEFVHILDHQQTQGGQQEEGDEVLEDMSRLAQLLALPAKMYTG